MIGQMVRDATEDHETREAGTSICDVIEDLSEVVKRLDAIEHTLKFQILNNADRVEERVREQCGASGPPISVEEMVKRPIRRQIGNLKPIRIQLENLVARLRKQKEKD